MTLKEAIEAGHTKIRCPDWSEGFCIQRYGNAFYKINPYISPGRQTFFENNRYVFTVEDIVSDDWVGFAGGENK